MITAAEHQSISALEQLQNVRRPAISVPNLVSYARSRIIPLLVRGFSQPK